MDRAPGLQLPSPADNPARRIGQQHRSSPGMPLPSTDNPARRALLAGLCCGTMLLAGCSWFRPRFVKPTLTVVSVTLGHSDLLRQHLIVRLKVENPNGRDLPVAGLAYDFALNGEQVAHGESTASFIVPARGEAEFDTTVTTNMATAVLRILGRGNSTPVNYRFSGKVQLSSGLIHSVPFDKVGVIDWH